MTWIRCQSKGEKGREIRHAVSVKRGSKRGVKWTAGTGLLISLFAGSSLLTQIPASGSGPTVSPVCSNGNTLGLYQSITVNGVVTFKELDVDLGEYVDVPGVSLDLRPFGPWSNSVQINGAGVDPTSGKIFGAINISSTSHIIQFDLTSPTPSVGFVGNFSSGRVWAADFLADGTFVFHDDVASVNKVRSISNLSGLPVFETRTEAPVLTPQTHQATVFENAGDITTVRQSDGTELLIGYDYPANKVAVVDASDLDSGALYTTTLPDGFNTSGYNDVVGAAWVSSSGDAYFSLNNGGGIYAVFADDLDTVNQTAVLSATEVTSTQQTNQNDGFGCPTAADAPEEAGATSGYSTITYDAQGGAPTPVETDCPIGTLTPITNDTPELPNYLFSYWNTAADGSGTIWHPGDWADCSAGDQTLYAQYSPETKNVAYDYNGASDLSVSYICFSGGTFVVDSDIPDYEGFNFVGWQDTATDTMYDPGDVVSCDDFSFLAIWETASTTTAVPATTVVTTTTTTAPAPEENIDTTTTEPESVVLPTTGTKQSKWPILLLIASGSALSWISRRPRTSPEIPELH